MSEAEGLLWRLERDPFLSSNVANVTILDRSPDFARLRRRLERGTQQFPRLRQRVQPGPVSLTPPTWVDDPVFDLDFHVRHIALPPPGRLEQLLEHAVLFAADPFERTRPLWEFVVVDGLEGDRAALLQKFHHTVVDGEAGVRLLAHFVDLERDAPELPPLTAEELPPPEPAPEAAHPADAFVDFVTATFRLPIGLARQAAELLGDPARIPAAGAAALETVRGLVTQLQDTEKARSPLWTERSLKRRLEVLRVPLEETRLAAKALGGTLNVAFLTAATQAAGQYHRRMGQPVDILRASMAVSTRTESSGANAYTLVRLLVPTGDIPIAERFAIIRDAAATARAASATANLDALATVAATLPLSMVTRIARQQTQTVDFATSNVRAAPFTVYIAGAKVLENYPIGPLGGVAFNLTLLSYDASLDMGLHLDARAVAEPTLLRELTEDAFRALVAAGAEPAPGSPG
jgi:diacylglycerol O-acyltransferase / wax synthase